MHTSIKFNRLNTMSHAQKLSALAGAIAWEMKKPIIAQEMGAHRALGQIKALDQAAQPISFERIKAHLKGEFGAKYATPNADPELTAIANEFEQFIHSNMPEIDMSFAALFDLVDLRGSTHDQFNIIETNAGLTWQQRQPGEPTKIRKNVSEAKTSVPYLEFSDGLGLLDAWLQFNQFWSIDEAIAEFITTHYDKMASTHYGLLTALSSGVDQAFSTDDTTTFNNAAATIVRACHAKGYNVGSNPGFYIVCAPEYVGRMERMITAMRGSVIVAHGTVNQPIAHRVLGIISTTHVAAADTGYYLVLPGRKMKRGVWKDLQVESTRNAYTSASDMVGVAQYNAAIGDSAQVRRVKYA